MNKIVELIINLEEFEFDDLGVEIMSLVDRPAIEVGWMAFNEEQLECQDCFDLDGACWPGYEAIGMKNLNGKQVPNCVPVQNSQNSLNDDFQAHVLKLASELGKEFNAEDLIYVDVRNNKFDTISDLSAGIRALDALSNLAPDTEIEKRYRYAGPAGQRTFCATLKALNRTYSRADITAMNRFNPGFGENGAATYSVFEYKGGPNCTHYWEELIEYNNGTRDVLVSVGPVEGGPEEQNAGMSNNSRDRSPNGAVSNNAYFSKNWSFSDDDQMIITGPAMIPNALIARKDEMGNLFHVYFSKETVEKVARKFLADNNAHVTDINHDDNIVEENTLLESWIVEDPKMDKSTAMGFNVPKSTWMVSYKINNKDTWNKIKAGELNGFSVAGSFLEKLQPNG